MRASSECEQKTNPPAASDGVFLSRTHFAEKLRMTSFAVNENWKNRAGSYPRHQTKTVLCRACALGPWRLLFWITWLARESTQKEFLG